MQKYRVEITGVAESDILDIFRYIASDNPAAADHWVLAGKPETPI